MSSQPREAASPWPGRLVIAEVGLLALSLMTMAVAFIKYYGAVGGQSADPSQNATIWVRERGAGVTEMLGYGVYSFPCGAALLAAGLALQRGSVR